MPPLCGKRGAATSVGAGLCTAIGCESILADRIASPRATLLRNAAAQRRRALRRSVGWIRRTNQALSVVAKVECAASTIPQIPRWMRCAYPPYRLVICDPGAEVGHAAARTLFRLYLRHGTLTGFYIPAQGAALGPKVVASALKGRYLVCRLGSQSVSCPFRADTLENMVPGALPRAGKSHPFRDKDPFAGLHGTGYR